MSSRLVAIGLAAVLVLTVIGTAFALDTYEFKDQCPGYFRADLLSADSSISPDTEKYPDGRGFYLCEETSYVADKLNQHGVRFDAGYKGADWGRLRLITGSPGYYRWEYKWLEAADAVGVTYDTTQKPFGGRSVAWFANQVVAYVESVTLTGDVVVSEYKNGDYNRKTLKKGTDSNGASLRLFCT